jgi:hypothetical protein
VSVAAGRIRASSFIVNPGRSFGRPFHYPHAGAGALVEMALKGQGLNDFE